MAQDGVAYWYRNGKLIKLHNQVHITDLCDNPQAFGIPKETIDAILKKHNATKFEEGKAREELMCLAMDKGWIRVRQSKGRQGTLWTFQFDNFAKRKRDLKELVSKLYLDMEQIQKWDELHFLSYDGTYDDRIASFYGKEKSIDTFVEEIQKERKGVKLITEYKFFNY